MTRYEARVNLRLDQETYDAYAKVAEAMNVTVVDLVRSAVLSSMPAILAFGSMVDKAKEGDTEAIKALFAHLMDASQGQLDLARATVANASGD